MQMNVQEDIGQLNSLEHIIWPTLELQNIPAKEIYWARPYTNIH